MKINKIKVNVIKYHPFNYQKIKNIINLKVLKKNKKNNINKNFDKENYIVNKTKLIFKKLAKKYNKNPEFYY